MSPTDANAGPVARPDSGSSRAAFVHDRLLDEILHAVHRPGEVLSEAELATRFDVSKTPVRDALLKLSHAGWVTVLPRKGYMVRPVSLGDIRDIFAVRRMIEPALARDAAHKASSNDVANLGLVLAQQAAASGIEDALRAARDFHLALATLTGSDRVRVMLETLVDEIQRLHYLLPHVEHHITSQDELDAHRELITALQDRDGNRASELMLTHLKEVSLILVGAFTNL